MENLNICSASCQGFSQQNDIEGKPLSRRNVLFRNEIASCCFSQSQDEGKVHEMAVTNDEWNSMHIKDKALRMEINKCQADSINKDVHSIVKNETNNLNLNLTSTLTKSLENESANMNDKLSLSNNCVNSECLRCSHCLKSFRNKRKLKTHLYLCHCITENMVSMQDNLFPTHEPVHSTSESDNEVCELVSASGQKSALSTGHLIEEDCKMNEAADSGNVHIDGKESSFVDSLRELEAANTLIDLQLQNSGIPLNTVINTKDSKTESSADGVSQDPTERNTSPQVLQRNDTKTPQVIQNVNSKTNSPPILHDVQVQRANVIVYSKAVNDGCSIQNSEYNSKGIKSEKGEKSSESMDYDTNEMDNNVSGEDRESKDITCDTKTNKPTNCFNSTSCDKDLPLLPIPFPYPVVTSSPGNNLGGSEMTEFQNGIRIDCETALVTKLEGIHPTTKQLYILYKCCLCGNAFSGLAALHSHVGNHGNSNKENNCGKCGATFKCHGQLELHDQLHQAIENKTPVPLNPGLFINPFGMLGSQMDDLSNQQSSPFPDFTKLDPYWSMLQRIYSGYPGNLYSSLNLGNFPLLEDNQQSLLNKLIDTKETKSRSSNKVPSKMPLNKPVYQCSYCPKVFDRVFSLQRHERVHTGIKPCSCKICGRGFSEKRNLRHHVIRFHSDSNRKELLWRAHRQKSRLKNPHGPKKLVSFLKRAATCILNSMGQTKLDSQDDSSDACTEDIKVPELLQLPLLPTLDGTDKKSMARMIDDTQTSSVASENRNCIADIDRNSAPLSHNNHVQGNAQVADLPSPQERINRETTKQLSAVSADSHLKDNSANVQRNEQTYLFNGNQRTDAATSPVPRNDNEPSASISSKYSYPCNYCSKSFCSTSDLKRHMDFHKDIRPYKCPSCEYRSRTNSQLKVHMMRHQGIRQFLCHPCNYGGVTQSDLNRHLKTRTHILRTRAVCSS